MVSYFFCELQETLTHSGNNITEEIPGISGSWPCVPIFTAIGAVGLSLLGAEI